MAVATRILELTTLENYQVSEAEVAEYADFLGIDVELERDLFPIAEAGLAAALPKHWIPCQVEGTEDYFYYNKKTRESIWDHPLDDLYRQLVVKARAKRRCYAVSLVLLEDDVDLRIRATNLAGDTLVLQPTALDESLADVVDKLRSAIVVDDDRVLCFVLPNAKMTGFSCRSKEVKDVFELR